MIEEVTYEDGRAVLEALGGLCNAAGLGRRWGITRERVRQLMHDATFPVPVWQGDSGMQLWFGDEVDTWRAETRERQEAAKRAQLAVASGRAA